MTISNAEPDLVEEKIAEKRELFVARAVEDIDDPNLRSVVRDAANDEFNDKVERVRAAFRRFEPAD